MQMEMVDYTAAIVAEHTFTMGIVDHGHSAVTLRYVDNLR